MKTFENDRPILENKYHKVSEPFDPYRRMAYHGYAFDGSTGMDDGEILQELRNMQAELAALPHPIAKGKAVAFVLEHTRIDIAEHDYFVGLYSVNRLASEVTTNVWNDELFSGKLKTTAERMEKMRKSGAADIWPDFDHVIPDWNAVLSLGFTGLLRRVRDYRALHKQRGTLTAQTDAHFTGMELLYSAILRLIERCYALAKSKGTERGNAVAECLLTLTRGAPTTTYEAMQAIYLYFMVSECFDGYQVRSLGHGLDSTLYPFYQRDLERGVSREELKELLAYFLFQWQAIGNYWGQPFYMGGANEDGSTKFNELSRDILEVYDELGLYNPKIQLKVRENTPDWLLNKVFDMIRRGHNCFVFCCEPAMMRAVMSYGGTEKEAREIDIRGCYETGVRANEVSTLTGYVNALKAVEYVFTNGYDELLGERLGLATGDVEKLTTFEAFYAAVLAQWAHLIDLVLLTANEYEPYLSYINPSLTYSATIEGSLAKGVDAYQGGVKYNNSAVLNCSFASLVDSVMAVKELVYDRRLVSLSTLQSALKANWVGYESLRARARRCKKYGNDEREADAYAEALAQFFAKRVARPNARGGVYKSLLHSAMQFVWQGERTLATPDGRRAGEECSKNASPSVGMDNNGVTALVNSALKLRPYTYTESFCLDLMLHPSATSGEEGLRAMKGILTTYLQGGGMSMQMNVFNAERLRDAQNDPERYQNLQVRVCGWNVLWNNLSKKEQDAYILRAESIV